MNRFHSGQGSHGFSDLLRSAGHKGVQIPANNMQPGAKPQKGGSVQRRPNDKATQRFMDSKTRPPHARAGRGSGAREVQNRTPEMDPEHRIARGPVGSKGRAIHHATDIERAGEVPGHISVGPKRSGASSQKLSSTGKTRMSPEIEGRPGVPAHQSVINRGPKGTGGYKHSRAKVANMAHGLDL